MTSLKPKLILISDLWGKENGDWMEIYIQELNSDFKVTSYDSRELAEIPQSGLSEKEIHAQFVEGGIDRATENILRLEKNKCLVLAFSIGGTIAWKAALNGMPILKLIAVSSTRLRKEFQKPRCEIELIYGAQDENRPMDEWFEAIEVFPSILLGKPHELYTERNIIEKICGELSASLE